VTESTDQRHAAHAAQLALGHSWAEVTDAVYAERDQTRVVEVMRRLG